MTAPASLCPLLQVVLVAYATAEAEQALADEKRRRTDAEANARREAEDKLRAEEARRRQAELEEKERQDIAARVAAEEQVCRALTKNRFRVGALVCIVMILQAHIAELQRQRETAEREERERLEAIAIAAAARKAKEDAAAVAAERERQRFFEEMTARAQVRICVSFVSPQKYSLFSLLQLCAPATLRLKLRRWSCRLSEPGSWRSRSEPRGSLCMTKPKPPRPTRRLLCHYPGEGYV